MSNRKKKVWTISAAIIYGITVLATVGLLLKVLGLDVLPAKFIAPILLVVAFILLFIYVLFFLIKMRKKKARFTLRAVALALAFVLVTVDVAGILMINKFEETMSNMLEDDKNNTVKVEEFIIGVYVRAEDKAENLEDAKRYDFGYSLSYDRNNTKTAINVIENELDRKLNLEEFNDNFELVDKVLAKEKDAFIMSASYMDIIEEQEGYTDIASKIKCIHECVVTRETIVEEKEEVPFEITENPFVVYLSGHDTSYAAKRANSDVNILAVVNPKSRQILLINTPRDFYVPISVSEEGELDKLTHCGTYGVECSMDTLNELYDIDIRYYAQLNFTGFIRLIDALGGITIYSEKAFISTNLWYEFEEGYNEADGIKALEFVRERKKFAGGDHVRGRHQMAVIKGILEKMMSKSMLLNYSEIMESMGTYFKTNVPQSDIFAIVKMQLNDMSGWNIQSYAVSGKGENKTSYSLPNLSTYVMIPDQSTVDHGKTLIQMVMNGETIDAEDLKVPTKE